MTKLQSHSIIASIHVSFPFILKYYGCDITKQSNDDNISSDYDSEWYDSDEECVVEDAHLLDDDGVPGTQLASEEDTKRILLRYTHFTDIELYKRLIITHGFYFSNEKRNNFF